jgi:hypothetical protein
MRFLEMFAVLCLLVVTVGSDHLSARKIESSETDFLNIALESMPHIFARLELTKRNSIKVCRLIKAKKHFSKREIVQHLKEIIDPVKTFFNEIKEFKTLVLGLIRNSLIEGKTVHHEGAQEKASEKNSHNNQKIQKPDKELKNHEESKEPEPFLIKFINASLDIEKFTENEITTQDNLKKISLEFIRFITDIKDSLTQNAKKSYEEFMKKLTSAKDCPLEQKTPDVTRLYLEAIWDDAQQTDEECCPVL